MSNPDTDAQSEDMLSSFRRLVSSDVGPDDREAKAVEQSSVDASNPGLDRLVLGPDLRVTAAKDKVSDEMDSSADLVWDNVEARTQAVSVDEPAVSHEDVVVSKGGEDKGAVIATEDDDTEAEPDSLSGDIDPEDLRFLFQARKRSALEGESEEDESEEDEPEAEIDESEVAQSPEIIAADSLDKQPPFLLTNPQLSADKTEAGAGDGEQDQQDGGDDAVAIQSSNKTGNAIPPEKLAAKVAAIEAVVAQAPDRWDFEDDGTDEGGEAKAEVLEWEDHHDLGTSGEEPEQAAQTAPTTEDPVELEEMTEDDFPSVDAALEPEGVTDKDVPDVDAAEDGAIDLHSDHDDANRDVLDDEDAVLDEEALRELVNDIVVQELNGKLGERITHNVRKLVRRELQRALASRDLS